MKPIEQLMDQGPEGHKGRESIGIKLNLLEKILFRFPPTKHYLSGRQRRLAEKAVENLIYGLFKKL